MHDSTAPPIGQDDKKIELSVYPRKFTTYDNAQWSGRGWRKGETTHMGFANLVYQGYPVTSVFEGGHRKRNNFILGQFIGVDIDTGSQDMWDLKLDDFFLAHGALIHVTKSHNDHNPRSRLIFFLEEPITDAEDFRTAQLGVNSIYSNYDRNCIDPARWFWGNGGLAERENSYGIHVQGHWLPVDLALSIGKHEQSKQPLPGPRSTAPDTPIEKRLSGAIAKATDGNRNAALNWFTYKLGQDGMGWSDVEQAIHIFQQAVDRATDPFPLSEALKTGKSGWRAGAGA